MTNFKILTRTESTTDYSKFSINEYEVSGEKAQVQIIKDFLLPENFKHEDFHQIQRLERYKNYGFLGHAFNLNKLELSDFREYNKRQTIDFFDKELSQLTVKENIINPESYLRDKFISMLSSTKSETYYVISKDFFETDLPFESYDECHKLRYDAIIYEPYYLILWFSEKNILTVCEYFSD